jgi:hypothetical protein
LRAVVPPLGVCDGHAQVMAGEPLELPLTATAGSQRYTVRFDHGAGSCRLQPPPAGGAAPDVLGVAARRHRGRPAEGWHAAGVPAAARVLSVHAACAFVGVPRKTTVHTEYNCDMCVHRLVVLHAPAHGLQPGPPEHYLPKALVICPANWLPEL